MPSDPVPTDPLEPGPSAPPPFSDAPPEVQRDGGPGERLRQFEQERGLDPDDASVPPVCTDDDGRIDEDHVVTSDEADEEETGGA
jgi:hypothetical protein